MWKNYFKIAWRNIRRNAVNSIQNILGLAIAFVICLFSVLYLLDETSYDKFHENADRIYRVNTDIKINDYERHSAKSNDVIGPLLKESFHLLLFQQRSKESGGQHILLARGAATGFLREQRRLCWCSH